jgi:hypothetical protein
METLASTQRLILIDEGGNFDFSPKGTSYFIMTAVSKSFSYSEHAELAELKYDLLSEQRLLLAGFHASEDRQVVRNQVFRIIQEHLHHHRIYAVIYEKGTLPAELKRSTNLYTHAIDSFRKWASGDARSYDFVKECIISEQLITGK